MAENRGRLLKTVYGICFSALTLVVGVLVIRQAWSVYRSAPQNAYTPANIAAHFSEIAVAVWCWVGALVGNILLSCVFPEPKERPKAFLNARERLDKMKLRLDSESALLRTNAYDVLRGVFYGIGIFLCVVVTVVCLRCLFDEGYSPNLQSQFFTEHGAVADRLVRIAPWIGAATLFVVAAALFDVYCTEEETRKVQGELTRNAKKRKAGNGERADKTELSKALEKAVSASASGTEFDIARAVESAAQKSVKAEDKRLAVNGRARQALIEKQERKAEWENSRLKKFFSSPAFVWSVRGVALVLAVVFIVTGIANGGMTSVLEKAINICTQCIGLG